MPAQKTKFSVLISVYANDNPLFFREALDSIIKQTYPPSEVVILIDGPVPESLSGIAAEYKAAFAFVKTVVIKDKKSYSESLNEALKECSHNLVARMDSDDISPETRFEKQIGYFDKDPELCTMGGQIREIEAETKTPLGIRKVPLTWPELQRFVKKRSPINNVTAMFKKDAVLSVGGYIPMQLNEDYYLWIRMAYKNLKMENTGDILGYARVDRKMYFRRGGFAYFKSNKAVQDIMLKLGIINVFEYSVSLIIRFCVQVLMPNSMRSGFYNRFLRRKEK